jgi:hypothetical protein
MSMKKAQSAMEYLMTYGWAILIVIIVAAALYALGIFNPATYTGRIPTGFTTLGAPTDWDLTSNGDFDIILNNKLASQITIWNFTVMLGDQTDWDDTPVLLAPGAELQYPYALSFTSPTPTSGTTYSVDVEILYSTGVGFNHTESGRVTGLVSQA